jgi:membrane-associated protein
VVAGATGFNRRRFFTLTIVSGLIWALYGVFIGVLVGGWVNHNAILGAAIAIAIALTFGVGLDAVASRASRARPAEERRAAHEGGRALPVSSWRENV